MGFSPCQVRWPEVSMRCINLQCFIPIPYTCICLIHPCHQLVIYLCVGCIYIYHGWYLWSNMLYIELYDIWYRYLCDVYMYLSGNDWELSRVYDIYHVVSSDNGQDLEEVLESFPSCKNQHPSQPFFQLQLGQLNHATHDHDWLVVEPTPLKNMSSSVGMMTFPYIMGIHRIHVPNHHPDEDLNWAFGYSRRIPLKKIMCKITIVLWNPTKWKKKNPSAICCYLLF